VFLYHFAYDDYDAPAGDASAFHGLELVYIFGNFAAVSFGPLAYQPNDLDRTMADWLGAAWTSFARGGDPSTVDLAWVPYATASDGHSVLDLPPATADGLRAAQCDFWDSLVG
jgi:para-nitrobenzyl esterase